MSNKESLGKQADKKEKRFFLIFAAVVVVVGVGLLLWGQYTASINVFDAACFRYNIENVKQGDSGWSRTEEEQTEYDALRAQAAAWKDKTPYVTRKFITSTVTELYDGAPESQFSYDLYTNSASDVTVIILHGYDESTEDAEVYAPYWWASGYNVIIPQIRGHRGDKTDATSFGPWERCDLYDLMVDAELLDKTVIISARSLGADAAVLLAGDMELDAGIDMIVAETVYTDLKSYELHELKRQFNLGNFLTGMMLDSIIKRGFQFDPADISVRDAAARTDTAILFLCGDSENVVGYDMTQEVYNACGGDKRLLTVEGGRYPSLYQTALKSGEYASEVEKMILSAGID